jgi:hypothetical protein
VCTGVRQQKPAAAAGGAKERQDRQAACSGDRFFIFLKLKSFVPFLQGVDEGIE